jgi:peptidoglycan/xylan/chitin deacetylase (PgdA/CDA1 family)
MIIINPSPARFLFPWILWKGDAATSHVHLTFDDGPHPEYTPQVLDILKTGSVKGTFFLTGENVVRYPGLVRRIAQEGHTLGNHGFTHASLAFKKREIVLSEIERTDEAIRQIVGEKPAFFRPPYGRFDPRFQGWMKKMEHRLALWSLITCDFQESNPIGLVERVKRHIHPGAILLLHDGHRNSPVMIEALPELLDLFRNLRLSSARLE